MSLEPVRDTRRLGTAAWADPEWVAATYGYRDGTVWLGRLPNGAPVGYGDDRHVCLVSGSRAGKGTSSIVNNLCLWPGSVVVIDPKGENATVTAARRGAGSDQCEGLGQAVHVLDPFKTATIDDTLRSRFNPFDALDANNEEAIDEAARVADALVVVHEDSKDPFWEESARALIKALILHVLTAEQFEGSRNLITLRKLITSGDWRAVEILRESGTPDEDIRPAHELLWGGVEENEAFGGLVASGGHTFANMLRHSPKQYESVLQIANRNTEFLDSPAMQRCVEVSDFKLSDLKTNRDGLSLYLCLPQRYMNTHYRWLRMMIALVVSEMEIVRGRPATGYPILVVLDEFAGLKRMEVIEHAVAQIAGYGVKLFFVLQSLEQLKAVYKDNWETFLSNAGLKVFFSLDDHFSREYVSKLIGETEVIREVRSASENVSESETYSESRSESFGESESRGRSISGGTNSSVSESESVGVNRSTSRSVGGSAGASWREGYRWSGGRQFSSGKNWSNSESEGTSETRGVSRTQGTSQGWSDSATSGTSRTVGTTTGTSRGASRGQTSGSSETVHRRALIAPDEIGRVFARIDDTSDGCFPGLALAAISGKPPVLLRRVNYYEDPQFIDLFLPHPDHPHEAAQTFELGAETLLPFLEVTGPFDLKSWAVKPGDVVVPGEALAQISYAGATPAFRCPLPGKISGIVSADGVPADLRLYALVDSLSEGGSMFGIRTYSGNTLNEPILKVSGVVNIRSYHGDAALDPLIEFRSLLTRAEGGVGLTIERWKTRATWTAVGVLAAFAVLARVVLNDGIDIKAVGTVAIMAALGLYRYFSEKIAALNKTRVGFQKLILDRRLVFARVPSGAPAAAPAIQSEEPAREVHAAPSQIAQKALTAVEAGTEPTAPDRAALVVSDAARSWAGELTRLQTGQQSADGNEAVVTGGLALAVSASAASDTSSESATAAEAGTDALTVASNSILNREEKSLVQAAASPVDDTHAADEPLGGDAPPAAAAASWAGELARSRAGDHMTSDDDTAVAGIRESPEPAPTSMAAGHAPAPSMHAAGAVGAAMRLGEFTALPKETRDAILRDPEPDASVASTPAARAGGGAMALSSSETIAPSSELHLDGTAAAMNDQTVGAHIAESRTPSSLANELSALAHDPEHGSQTVSAAREADRGQKWLRDWRIAAAVVLLGGFAAWWSMRSRVEPTSQVPAQPNIAATARSGQKASDAAVSGIDEKRAVFLSRQDLARMDAALNSTLLNEKTVGSMSKSEATTRLLEEAAALRETCNSGVNVRSCAILGNRFETGASGVEKDLSAASALYRRGCDLGDPLSCTGLGYLYDVGKGTAEDNAIAGNLYRRSCDAGYSLACNNLGFMYENGDGIPEDKRVAAELYRQACDGGYLSACYNLAALYVTGQGVAKDEAAGVRLLRQACNGGLQSGCESLREFCSGRDIAVCRQ